MPGINGVRSLNFSFFRFFKGSSGGEFGKLNDYFSLTIFSKCKMKINKNGILSIFILILYQNVYFWRTKTV